MTEAEAAAGGKVEGDGRGEKRGSDAIEDLTKRLRGSQLGDDDMGGEDHQTKGDWTVDDIKECLLFIALIRQAPTDSSSEGMEDFESQRVMAEWALKMLEVSTEFRK